MWIGQDLQLVPVGLLLGRGQRSNQLTLQSTHLSHAPVFEWLRVRVHPSAYRHEYAATWAHEYVCVGERFFGGLSIQACT